jgi:26S proteasome regulatory subunit N13
MLNIKAGRAFRRASTSWVDPQATKGLLSLAPGDDGLLHFTWKNRETNSIEDVTSVQHALCFHTDDFIA